MKIFNLLVLSFAFSCATAPVPFERNPAQVTPTPTPTAIAEQKLSHWDAVKESMWDRFYGDPLLGLFVNDQRPVAFDLIKEARRTIDIEIYEMKDPTFRKLLGEAMERGVKVRIVKDSATVGDSCNELEVAESDDEKDCSSEKEYIKELQAKGAEYVYFNKKELCGIEGRSCFQHGKMIITDNKYLLLSTGNFNSSSFCNLEAGVDKCNRDYSYVTKNRQVIDDLRQVWKLDHAGKSWDFKQVLSKTNHGLTVSPQSAPRLVSLIKSAKKSVWVQNQYLEDPAINAALLERAKQGVSIHVQVSAFCNFGEPSPGKKDKTTKIYSEFDAAGIKSKVFHAKMLVGTKPGYLHAKAIVVDEKVGWVGSINGSETSSIQNREFGIIFNTKSSVDRLYKTVSEDFNHPLSMDWQDALNCGRVPAKPRLAP